MNIIEAIAVILAALLSNEIITLFVVIYFAAKLGLCFLMKADAERRGSPYAEN